MRALDLAGKVFDRLTVIERSGVATDGKITWRCRCECGNEVVLAGSRIKRGAVRSCGCLRNEKTSERGRARSLYGLKQGEKRPAEWAAWQSMLQRCRNDTHQAYARYGGRGIAVHPDFLEYGSFLSYIGPKPSPDHSLDRFPDPEGNYEPGNVRWATWDEQNRNKKCVKLTEEKVAAIRRMALDGAQFKDIAAKFNVSTATISDVVYDRIWRGIPPAKVA